MASASRSPRISRWVFPLYLLLIVATPLPLGSNRPWAWGVLELWVLVLALAWLGGIVRGHDRWAPVLRRSAPVLVIALLWAAFAWLQLLPLPIAVLEVLSPEAARLHLAAAAPEGLLAAPLTVDRYATLDAACLTTAYIAFFALTLALLDDRDRLRAAAYTLVFSGILQAAYATVADVRAGIPPHGTFVNQNHFASYLLLCLSTGVGILIGTLRGTPFGSWKAFMRNAIDWMLTPKMVLRLGLLVMVIALVLTRSRMANSAFFISLLATGVIGLLLARRATRSMIILIASLIALDVFVVGTYFGARKVVERVVQTTPQGEDRDEVAAYALDMWKDFPVFGAGLGSFRSVFPRYSGERTSAAYTHAHNDYVELGAETGIVGFGLLGALVCLSFLAALRAQWLRSDPLHRGLSFGAMMGIAALMIHSTVDFNLQIPANALTFMLVLAFAWLSRYQGEARKRPSEASSDVAAPRMA